MKCIRAAGCVLSSREDGEDGQVLTLMPGSSPWKGALLKDTRALTLSGKPWLSSDGFRRGSEPSESVWASSGCFSRYDSWKQRHSSRFRNWAWRRGRGLTRLNSFLCHVTNWIAKKHKSQPINTKLSIPLNVFTTKWMNTIRIMGCGGGGEASYPLIILTGR